MIRNVAEVDVLIFLSTFRPATFARKSVRRARPPSRSPDCLTPQPA